jgi:hypothetical protein
MRDKALRAVAEDRVRVIRANEHGIALDVTASKPDADTLARATYRTLVCVHEGTIRRECGCPAMKRCYHIAAAELLWTPGPSEVSSR